MPGQTQARGKRAPRKRADGEGTLSQHKTGMWRGRIMVGYRPDGQPEVREVYGKSQEDARKKLDELRRQRDDGSLVSAEATQQTVGAFLKRWLEVAEPNLRPTT